VTVPGRPELAAGDMQGGPPSIADNAVANVSHVSSQVRNDNLIDAYSVQESESDTATCPFIHPVELKGEKGISTKVPGLFDNGAMISSICKTVFLSLKKTLGELTHL
jgi:hypothetical protein